MPEPTLRRWRDEMIGLLASKAPRLDRALRKTAKRGGEVVLIDGTLIPTQRRTGSEDRPNFSDKHHRRDPALVLDRPSRHRFPCRADAPGDIRITSGPLNQSTRSDARTD
nr:hypothetical protein [Streptomyces sp. 846.5]